MDSTALIEILKGSQAGRRLLADLDDEPTCTTELNRYEILRGAIRHGKPEEEAAFEALCDDLTILPLTGSATERAARIYGDLVERGERIGDIDCLIAGIMLANDVDTIVTRNAEHFRRIPGVKVVEHN